MSHLRICLLGLLAALVLAGTAVAQPAAEGELLYNGIRLPAAWPPERRDLPAEPEEPFYLKSPPDVIPIDVGRQLFVDDFLIQETTLQRSHHAAEYVADNPVLKPDKPWEGKSAMVFSDGVWYDPLDRLFKMWYYTAEGKATGYATSKDGRHWEKPALDVQAGTNLVHVGQRDSATVWLDLLEKDPAKRYKMWRSCSRPGTWGLSLHFSPDGIHWSEPPFLTGSTGDRTTVFYNPFRNVWVYSLRHGWGQPRRRRYFETKDLLNGPQWKQAFEPTMWAGADALDLPREDMKVKTELYNLDCVGYESILLGMFTIWHGQDNTRPKPNDVCLGYSRDGWSWSRPCREPFVGVSEKKGDWNWGNVQSAGGCCLVMGDRLWFYVSGRCDVNCTGLATLRRDGFVSMDAGGAEGTLTTRPVRFSGKYLFVNLDAPAGELRVEVLDQAGKPIPPFTKANCAPAKGDKTLLPVHWKGAKDLSALAGRPVRFRFSLKQGKLYAFWVSPETTGASHGFVAAGGPGYSSPTDTVGAPAYAAARAVVGR